MLFEKQLNPEGAELLTEAFVVWLTGMSGAGKTTISGLLADTIRRHPGVKVEILDGDELRKQLFRELGYSKDDRDENIRRIGFLAKLLSRSGVITIVAAISPYRAARQEVRSLITNFVEVYVHCPLSVLIARDTKGFYAKAQHGELESFTGVSDPYEPPLQPELAVDTSKYTARHCADKVYEKLIQLELLRR